MERKNNRTAWKNPTPFLGKSMKLYSPDILHLITACIMYGHPHVCSLQFLLIIYYACVGRDSLAYYKHQQAISAVVRAGIGALLI